MRILLAVDESENSHRAVKYVGSLLRRTPDVDRHPLSCAQAHASGVAGAWRIGESCRRSAIERQQLRDEQEVWIRKERESECPCPERRRARR